MYGLLIVKDQYDYSKMFDFAISLGIKVEYHRRDKIVRDNRVIDSFVGRKFDWMYITFLGQNPHDEDCVWLEHQLKSIWLEHTGEKSLPKLSNDYDYTDYQIDRLNVYKPFDNKYYQGGYKETS